MKLHRVLAEFVDRVSRNRISPLTTPVFVPHTQEQADRLVEAKCLRPIGEEIEDVEDRRQEVKVSELRVDDIEALAAGEWDAATLEAWLADEEGRDRPRKSALALIRARLTDLPALQIERQVAEEQDAEKLQTMLDGDYEGLEPDAVERIRETIASRMAELPTDSDQGDDGAEKG
ncbi:MAG: hypothetical protein QGD89_09165 [Actinomycetota bacterium]|nr:hypothetical protein [Actinomycetota bacterium]